MVEEEVPILSDKTLGNIKAELKANPNVVRFAFKRAMVSTKQPAYFFDMLIYELSVAERAAGITDEVNKRQYRLYVEDWGNDVSKEDESKVCWDGQLRWKPLKIPEPQASEQTFIEKARQFLIAEAKANRIKAGELIYGDDNMERATATVIDGENKEKRIIIRKNEEGKFLAEDYTPLANI